MTIVNLAGASDEIQDHVVYHLLTRIYKARVRYVRGLRGVKYPYPVVVVVEEAHRFAPPKTQRRTWSYEIISRIACEGRKFGIYLVIISQRPSRVDSDILSQCNSQIILRIINPKDIDALIANSESLHSEVAKLIPQLNVGEAIVTGVITPIPLVVKLRDRVLSYGGADLDVVNIWSKASQMAGLRAALEKVKREIGVNVKIGLSEIASLIDKVHGVMELKSLHVIRGHVYGAHVEYKLNERSWTCSECGSAKEPCAHVIALLCKSYMSGLRA